MLILLLICGVRRLVPAPICAAFILGTPSMAPGAESGSQTEVIAALSAAGKYQVSAEASDLVALTQWPETLVVELRSFTKGKTAQLLLKDPLPLPGWADGLVFSVNNSGSGADLGVTFQVLIQDATGQTFLFKTDSPKVPHRVQYFPNHFRARSIRFYVPGLKLPILVPTAGANIEAEGERRTPTRPFRLTGLQLESVAFNPQNGQENKPVAIYLSDFAATRLSREGSTFYYALDGEERFGELDPVPGVTLGQLGPHHGEEFSVSWEVRDRYDGQPFLTGGREFHLQESDPEYPLLLNEKIEIPVQDKGTYWIQMIRRWSQKAGTSPQRIDQSEFRLDVLKGKEPGSRSPIAENVPVPASLIRIAPDRQSMIYKEDEPFAVKTAFWIPKQANASWRIGVTRVDAEEVVRTAEGQLAQDARIPASVTLDLSNLPAASYRFFAELLVDGQRIDRAEKLIGRKGEEQPPGKIPPVIPSWQEMLKSDKSLVYLQAHLDEHEPEKRWERLKAFLDQVPTVTQRIEHLIRWRDVERLPGIYDWAEVDRVLAYAKTKGITALLWPSIVGSEPEWLPSFFEEPRNASGTVFGAPAYLFHGGRLNLWHAAPIREPSLRFLAALAERYKSNPAVHGYYVLTEHPGDSPVHNWLIGGSPETQENFRHRCRQTYSSIGALNQRWGTGFKSWSEIGIPEENASPRHRLDWLAFLRDYIGQYLVDAVKVIRKADSHRLVQVYLEGADPEALKQLKLLGGMVSDGGSQYPETFGGDAMGVAEHGLQRRAEEVSVGQWSAMFPTQLDATLFTMLLAGGANSNIKMFIPANKTFEELRRPPFSLDHFEQLIPVWNELRTTKPMPREVFTLFDRNAQLLDSGTTQFFGDSWANSLCMEAGLPSPWVPLELAVLGKMIFLPRITAYEQSIMEGLLAYVRDGGTLVMCADAGRKVVEAPAEDWALLKKFGFTPPAEKDANPNYIEAVPVVGEVFPKTRKSFRLREYWSNSIGADEQVIATFQGDSSRPAITWKPFGKGRVILIWASTIVPAGSEGDPILRDIARWAGISIHAEGTPASFWTNLLQGQAAGSFYGLVYRSSYPGSPNGPATDGFTRWSLPDGTYRLSELISGRDHGEHTGASLREKGMALKLKPFEVAIYRIQLVP